jgi:demethylmenaquinone methyltransferase/2-methoxy-6-polyprenyl-1,4-benzoquinol methylase
MSGTTPAGTSDERQAAAWVRGMFGRVAPRYDLLNHLLSFNIDRHWRNRTVRAVQSVLRRESATIIDLCCGTGDLTIALQHKTSNRVYGSDFSHPMLQQAHKKSIPRLFEADALNLPLRNKSADLLTVAFGFRNLANYEAGIREMKRVLRPGGMAAILEFSQPPNVVFAAMYSFYSRRVLPKIGALLSGAGDAYTYLPESVRKFPGPDELAGMMRSAGFASVGYQRLTFGIVALHVAIV